MKGMQIVTGIMSIFFAISTVINVMNINGNWKMSWGYRVINILMWLSSLTLVVISFIYYFMAISIPSKASYYASLATTLSTLVTSLALLVGLVAVSKYLLGKEKSAKQSEEELRKNMDKVDELTKRLDEESRK